MAGAQIWVDYPNVPQHVTELRLTIRVEPGRCVITAVLEVFRELEAVIKGQGQG